MKRVSFNLEVKFISLAAVIVTLISVFMNMYLYRTEFKSHMFEAERRAQLVSISTAVSFTNTLLYEEIGLLEEGGLLENQMADLLKNKDAAVLEMAVVDRDCHTIAASNYTWYDYQAMSECRLDKCQTDEMQTTHLKRGKIQQLETIIPLHVHGKSFGVLFIYFSLESELEYLAAWRLKLLVFTVLALFGGILVAVAVARILAKPIKKLADEMIKVSDTDFQPGFTSNRRDEIGLLEQGFLNMMGRLHRSGLEKEKSKLAMIRTEKIAAIGTLTAGLAHEIYNPLGGVITCLKRIKADQVDKEQTAQYIGLMENSLHQIKNLVGGLLDYSRAKDPLLKAVDINQVIQNATRILEIQLSEKQVELQLNLSAESPHILGDQEQLEQVLINLILNAVHAVSVNGQINIQTSYNSKNVFVSIEDNGIGIAPHNLDQIFDPFFTTKTQGEGTGLGLAVCQNIMSGHDGSIRVESNLGNGTLFFLDFPHASAVDDNWAVTCGAILAGGKSSRMGANKALKQVNGMALIEWVYQVMSSCIENPLLIADNTDVYKFLGLSMHTDIIKNIGPLGGIYTALKNCRSTHCLIVACDLPLISSEILQLLCREGPRYDVCTVDAGRGIEPLCAVYSCKLIPLIEKRINAGKYSINDLITESGAHIINISNSDFPETVSLLHNVNTPGDLSLAEKIGKKYLNRMR
ncbi:MAG: NTP transferase domain-containing protein [Candidatus Marinimicrobia bacterium]|nr:NTP transferase domain-containing protein [Candidatus Neomarinimicrobiota bacterium]